jgi:predicted aspartyl protease/Flp pilus assembly protein TadD
MSFLPGPVWHARAKILLFVWILIISAPACFAAVCHVVQHNPSTPADEALLAADYSKAETLYRTELSANAANVDAIEGLVHALLRDQKLQEASDAVRSALAGAPNSAALLTLRGEVEFRRGEPWTATQTAEASLKLDPCNPRTRLLLSQIYDINSLDASARKEILVAHQLDPEDPDIRGDWMFTLPRKQRMEEIEAYLAQPRGDDAEELRHLQEYLQRLKKSIAQPPKPCRLVSEASSAQIPFIYLMRDATHVLGFGLEVKLNDHRSRLQIDTGADGLVVTSSFARHAGLQAYSQNEVGGIGDEGEKQGYTAYADSIKIGGLEFQNCAVQVVESHSALEDVDGLIGMDVFSKFLVTLDYPGRKLLLDPLPTRPGDQAGAGQKLKTDDDEDADNQGQDQEQGQQRQQSGTEGAGAKPAGTASAAPAFHGPYDRYIAPEMHDWTKVFRVEHDLILPAELNNSKVKLFIMDTGAWTTIISPDAAREVTKVRSGSPFTVVGLNGEVQKVYSADDITVRFANLSQRALGAVALDTSKISKSVGMEISGFLGATTLGQLTIHIDYRDGLVKFDYDPKRVPIFNY